jgi:hypothetical protein
MKLIHPLKNQTSYILPGIDQILAEMIQTEVKYCFQIHSLICSIWNQEELPQQQREFITVPIHKQSNNNVVIIMKYCSHELHTKCYPTFSLHG